MPDPNWLLSSAAQSAAAIVGLIAAFLIHRLLTLGAERASLERRLSDIEVESQRRQAELGALDERILRLDTDAFIQEHASEIIESRGEVDLRDLLLSDLNPSRTTGELTPEFRRVTAIVKRAFNVLENKIDGYGLEPPSDLSDFAAETALALPRGEELQWYEAVYRKLHDDYLRAGRPGRRRRVKPPLLGVAAQTSETRSDLAEARESASAALSGVLSERERIVTSLRALERPPGIKAAALVLIYFTLTGVALPLVLMPLDADAFQPTAVWAVGGMNLTGDRLRGLLLAAFMSGLLFVLIYVLWAIRLAAPTRRGDEAMRQRSLSKEVP